METQEKPVLLYNTIKRGDIAIVGNALQMPSGIGVRLNDIINLDIFASKAEVSQVVTIGGSTPTIVAGATYKLRISIPGDRKQGWQRSDREFKTVASATIADQAVERASIYSKLAASINGNTEFPVVAVATAGTSLVLTDSTGYWRMGRRGVSIIRPVLDRTGNGFVDADFVTTTEGVYSLGIGADLLLKTALVDPVIGNAYQGDLLNSVLSSAVSGQNYHTVVIESLVNTSLSIQDGAIMKRLVQVVLIDDGTGVSTTNAAAFEYALLELEKAAFSKYKNDTLNVIILGDKKSQTSGIDGGTPSAGNGSTNLVTVGDSSILSMNVGAATSAAIASLVNIAGLGYDVDGDETDGEGFEFNTGVSVGDNELLVGRDSATIRGMFNIGDVTDATIIIGFRAKAAAGADYAAYTDYAVVGNIGGGENTDAAGNLNDGTDVLSADTGFDIADGVDFTLQVSLLADGSVKGFVNDNEVAILSAAATPLIFDANDTLIPFLQVLNVGGGSPTSIMKKLIILSENKNRTTGGFFRGA
jgi:hypothetical protein